MKPDNHRTLGQEAPTSARAETASGPAIRRRMPPDTKLRERDLAQELGVSEGELVASRAAQCEETGWSSLRLVLDLPQTFAGLKDVGEVMVLTRNDAAVHEKIGPFGKYVHDETHAMVIGKAVDTRIFPHHFAHAFAVRKSGGDTLRHSIQFFDSHGEAVHKIHARPDTDLERWNALVASLRHPEQTDTLSGISKKPRAPRLVPLSDPAGLNDDWRAMTDTLQIGTILKRHKATRLQAIDALAPGLAWQLGAQALSDLLKGAADGGIKLMCFVGSPGCIQIHTGPVQTVREMGSWLNIMDPDFHLHLNRDALADIRVLRKPVKRTTGKRAIVGHVTSIEAFTADGTLAIQFFGARHPDHDERPDWRTLVESLPRKDET